MYRCSRRSAPAARCAPGANRIRAVIECLEERRLLAHFAVIGDFTAGTPLKNVSDQIKSWNPDFVVTVGDNWYDDSSIDKSVGQYFHDYISPYSGAYGAGSPSGNRFWPTLGNHDYDNGASKYYSFFTLPGNERYYSTRQGNTEIFVVNSNDEEADGTSATSKQATWLKNALAASTATWKIVTFHHPAYTSGTEHDNTYMQWPFQQWGATAVISGHDHLYERILKNNFPYFVDGLGGAEIVPPDHVEPGSQIRYSSDYGAMLIDAGTSSIEFKFITRSGKVIDDYTINASSTGGGGGGGGGSSGNSLIPMGSTWKYLDNGSNQGSAWRALGFDDSSWKSGAGQLGYGDGDEETIVSYGSNANSKYITTYFRKSFTVADASAITALSLKLLRDDGAVVYLNGTEVYRNNMPSGSISSTTLASETVEDNTIFTSSISPSLLVSGNNVISVEMHQSDTASSDISFDFELDSTGGGSGSTGTTPTAPTSLTASAASTSQINLAWKDNSGSELGYRIERSTDGVNFTEIATTNANVTSYSDNGLTANTTYTYRVRAYNANGNSAYTNTASATTTGTVSSSLPSPWSDGDIGSVAAAGSASYAAGTFTIKTSGADIWNAADSFHYVYQKLTGDGTIIARVTGLPNTHAWAKAGVMMRESLSAGSTEASMNVSASSGTAFIYRTTTGASSDGDFSTGSATIWLKLVRAGSKFSAYRSSDGSNWTQVGAATTINMASTIYVGLGVTAKSTTALNTATFDNVSVAGQTQVAALAAPEFSSVAIEDPTSNQDLLALLA